MTSIAGKTALVVGGANGIGEAVTRLLAEQGAAVEIVDIAAEPARALERELVATGRGVRSWIGDATDDERMRTIVRSVVDKHGGLDVAVLSVFRDERAPIAELERDEWDRVIDVTLSSAYVLARACLPTMVDAAGGSIVFISSVHARLGLRGHPAYAAAKAGLCGLARQLAVEYGPAGVRVNTVSPGAVRVDHNRDRWAGREEAVRKAYPLGRLATPQDVARAVLFLASDGAGFVTGADLPVDGGLAATAASNPIWETPAS